MESFKRSSRHYRRRNAAKNVVFTPKKTRVGEPCKRLNRKSKGKVPSDRIETNTILKFGSFNVNGIDEASGGMIQDLLLDREFDVSTNDITNQS